MWTYTSSDDPFRSYTRSSLEETFHQPHTPSSTVPRNLAFASTASRHSRHAAGRCAARGWAAMPHPPLIEAVPLHASAPEVLLGEAFFNEDLTGAEHAESRVHVHLHKNAGQ